MMADGPSNLQTSSLKGHLVYLGNNHMLIFRPRPAAVKSTPTVIAHRLILPLIVNARANVQALDLQKHRRICTRQIDQVDMILTIIVLLRLS